MSEDTNTTETPADEPKADQPDEQTQPTGTDDAATQTGDTEQEQTATVEERLEALLNAAEKADDAEAVSLYRQALDVAVQKKHLLAIAADLGVDVAQRITIKEFRARLTEVIDANDPARQPEKFTEDKDPPPNTLPGKLPAGYRGSTRRLKNKKSGREFVWTPALARHPDMVEI